MATGVDELDRQHQVLIGKFNEFVEAMQSGSGGEKVQEILAFTQTYAAKHFSLEESHMTRLNCPVAAENKKAHAYFLQRFGELKTKAAAGGPSAMASIETMRELSTWFTTHIKSIDTQLAK
ncbi:MAG: hemerythrin family protein [Armatimonadetes bacterium]|nr:hemerythrin family protein [Armatimonadota bacterium]